MTHFELGNSHIRGGPVGLRPADSGAKANSRLFAVGAKPELGFLVALLLPSLAAIASFKELTVAGVNYLAVVTLLAPMALFLMIVVKLGLDPARLRLWPGHRAWLIWYAVIWCSLLWGEARDADAIKHAFELSTPYVFGVAGAMFVRTARQLRLLMGAVIFAILPSLMCVLVWKVGIVDAGDFAFGPALDVRPHSMSLLPIAGLAIAFFPARTILAAAVWSICLVISAVEGSRGVTLCILILPLFHPTFRRLHWKVLMATGLVAMGSVVFYLPAMQARLFPNTGSGSISDLFRSRQSGMGRFEAWPLIFERALDRPVLGHGVSSAFHFVPTIWDRMRSPHNEFLCVGYEMGLLGLVIYISVMAFQLFCIRRQLRDSSPTNQTALAAVYLTLIAFNIMACTDNPLSSNVRLLNPLFLVMGAAFGSLDHSHRARGPGRSEQAELLDLQESTQG